MGAKIHFTSQEEYITGKMVEFTVDGIYGRASTWAEEQVDVGGGYTKTVKCKKVCVTWGAGRAYREVTVRGTLSIKRAILAALRYALPEPEIRMVGKQPIYGEFIEVTL